MINVLADGPLCSSCNFLFSDFISFFISHIIQPEILKHMNYESYAAQNLSF